MLLRRIFPSFFSRRTETFGEEKCHLSDNIYDYWWVSQGKTTVPSIDDKEDMMFAHEAYNILGFTEDQTYNIYKSILIWLTLIVNLININILDWDSMESRVYSD